MDPAERLAFPVQWRPILVGWVFGSRESFARWFGPFHMHEEIECWGPPGPIDDWGFRFPCGLEIVLEGHIDITKCNVFADAPETEHAIRHLGAGLPFERPTPEQFAASLKRAKATLPPPWRVIRQDDAGVRYVLAEVATEREARCLAAHYEARGHKQCYWAEPR